MNIALGALILTILLLPGAVIQRAYYSSFQEKDKDLYIPFTELLFRGLVLSFVAHLVSITLLTRFGIHFNYTTFYQLIIADKIALQSDAFNKSFIQFGWFYTALLVFLYLLTKGIRRLVINNNWDIKYEAFKIANYWFLIFSARYLDANKKGRKKKTDLIWADIMVEDNIVYSGYLFDFEYSPVRDQLETITLKNAAKRTYKKAIEEISAAAVGNENTKVNSERHPLKLDVPRRIQGDAFVILAKDILNINLYYLSVEYIEKMQAQIENSITVSEQK